MTVDSAVMNDLLQRMARLEDIEAIRQLQYSYCRLMDDARDPGAVAALWVEDGIWETAPHLRFEGRADIENFFREHLPEVKFAAHYMANAEITIDGDRARSITQGPVPVTLIDPNGAELDQWMFVTWRNEYVKRNGRWFYQTLSASVQKSGFHITGWDKNPA